MNIQIAKAFNDRHKIGAMLSHVHRVLDFSSSVLDPRFGIAPAIIRSSIFDPPSSILLAVQLLDEAGAVQLANQARINKCFGVRGCGLWIRARQIVEHGLDAVRSWVGHFRKDVGIVFVGSL